MPNDTTKKTRQPSRETVLKREFNAMKKELPMIERQIEALKSAENKIAELTSRHQEILNRLPIVKSELIAEMGLD
jgi:tetrahydromethanopterin S-methyltransferase subunit G